MAFQQKEVENPVCNMKAKFEEKQIYTITDYDVLISEESFNKQSWGVAMSEEHSIDYDLYMFIEFDDNEFITPLSKRMIKYLVNEYNIHCIDDIIGLNIEFEICSEKEIRLNNNFITSIDIMNNYIEVDDVLNEFDIDHKNMKINSCLKDKKEHIYNYNICGDVTVEEVNTVEKENVYVTTLIVTNSKTNYTHEFDLEYPLLYNEENKVINFINEQGYGSTDGLIDEKITVDWAYKYDDCEIISRCGSMAIINKNNNLNKYNDKNSNYMKYIRNRLITFNIVVLICLSITYFLARLIYLL